MRPKVAIIDNNTLAALGLRNLLQEVMPMMAIDTYTAVEDIEERVGHEHYFHFFVSINVFLLHRSFFLKHQSRTIILSNLAHPIAQIQGFHVLPVDVPEDELVRSLLKMEQAAHHQGRNLPSEVMNELNRGDILSSREIEVLSLVAQGYLNKEIAERLHIGLTTVITHRKNIQMKLGMKSVSSLTVYAVMHGYVDISMI